MHLIVVGLNYKTAGVDIRERFHFGNEILPQAYEQLNSNKEIAGSVILSTCNRVELYACVDNIEKGFSEMENFLCQFHGFRQSELNPHLYKKNCQFAVSHLFKVSSSLDSMVLGEYQIQGQVRDAYFLAYELKATNNMLNKLFQTAIQIGKKVRSETEIGKGSVSVATLAVDLIKQIFNEEKSFETFLIGAGKIAALTAANLRELNSNISICNRSNEKALELAHKFSGNVVAYENRYSTIKENDIIIVSTSAKEYTVKKQDLLDSKALAEDKMKVFIDLSIPRNIDPEINELENCQLYSIDDINKLIDQNIDRRSKEIDKAENIITSISQDYYEWYAKQFILPVMHELKGELENLKSKTLNDYDKQLDSLNDEQKAMVKSILDNYSDKLIKVMMTNIKNISSPEAIVHMTKGLKEKFSLEVEKH